MFPSKVHILMYMHIIVIIFRGFILFYFYYIYTLHQVQHILNLAIRITMERKEKVLLLVSMHLNQFLESLE